MNPRDDITPTSAYYVTGRRDFSSIDIGVIVEENDVKRVLNLLLQHLVYIH